MLGKFPRHSSIRPGRLTRLALALLLCAAGTGAFGLDEDAMKGAYLYSLVKFVDWPAPLNPKDGQIYVCVLGEERLNALASALQQKPVHGRSISVVGLARREAKNCQVVFVAASESWRLQSLLSELAERPILTVGETDHFASRGGMIEFVLDDQRLGFEINNAAAQRTGLHISAQLLRLAKSVHK
jgi:hypothetical protein